VTALVIYYSERQGDAEERRDGQFVQPDLPFFRKAAVASRKLVLPAVFCLQRTRSTMGSAEFLGALWAFASSVRLAAA
jgi:hypothetical protein